MHKQSQNGNTFKQPEGVCGSQTLVLMGGTLISLAFTGKALQQGAKRPGGFWRVRRTTS